MNRASDKKEKEESYAWKESKLAKCNFRFLPRHTSRVSGSRFINILVIFVSKSCHTSIDSNLHSHYSSFSLMSTLYVSAYSYFLHLCLSHTLAFLSGFCFSLAHHPTLHLIPCESVSLSHAPFFYSSFSLMKVTLHSACILPIDRIAGRTWGLPSHTTRQGRGNT